MFGRNKTNEGRPAKVAPPDVGVHHVAGRTSAWASAAMSVVCSVGSSGRVS